LKINKLLKSEVNQQYAASGKFLSPLYERAFICPPPAISCPIKPDSLRASINICLDDYIFISSSC
jgi:hypothetical protein